MNHQLFRIHVDCCDGSGLVELVFSTPAGNGRIKESGTEREEQLHCLSPPNFGVSTLRVSVAQASRATGTL